MSKGKAAHIQIYLCVRDLAMFSRAGAQLLFVSFRFDSKLDSAGKKPRVGPTLGWNKEKFL